MTGCKQLILHQHLHASSCVALVLQYVKETGLITRYDFGTTQGL